MDNGVEDVVRKMPYSPMAEESILGAILLNPDILEPVMDDISSNDFYDKRNALIFKAMENNYRAGLGIDEVSVKNTLDIISKNYIIDIDFIRELASKAPTSLNYKSWRKIIKDKSLARKLIKASEKISDKSYEGKEDSNTILDEAEKLIFAISQKRGIEEYVPIEQLCSDAIDRFQDAYINRGAVRGLSTGFEALDNMLTGLHGSELILIAARPAMGKTAFVLNIANYVTAKGGVTTAVFSLEMSKEQLVDRIISMSAEVSTRNISSGDMSMEDMNSLVNGAIRVAETNLILDDTSSISVSELRRKCRKYKMDNDLGLVIIDYLQLMSGSGRESRQQDISEISRSLKQLARELNIPIIALSQLSRAVEKRQSGHRPILSDLRESGAIEQDADVVMFIYRDDYYNPDSEKKNIAEIIIAKHRKGPTGTVELTWTPEYTKFSNRYTGE